MTSASAGHDFTVSYLHEDAGFAAAPDDSDNKPFGGNATVETAEGSNNAVQVFEPGDRTPVEIIEQAFEGSWSVSFAYTNPWWLQMFYGPPTTSGNDPDGDSNSETWTHVYDGQDPQSSRIVIGRLDDGSDRILEGCIATSARVEPNVDGTAQVTIQGAYADETLDESGATSQPSLEYTPLTFADAALSINGASVGYVQQGTLAIENQTDLIRAWGQRTAIDFSPKQLTPTVDFRKISESGGTSNLQAMYGGSATTSAGGGVDVDESMTLGLDNGEAHDTTHPVNKVDFNVEGSFPDTYDESGLGQPQEDMTEAVNRLAEGVSAAATNETEVAR